MPRDILLASRASDRCRQALDNFAAADNRLPADVVRAIDRLWAGELKDNPLPW